jgi:NAD-dependent protein deacetylases, SIR2 family
MRVDEPCPACAAPVARPDVVWFGEMPYHMAEIEAHLAQAGLFAAIGTSGQVYPAAGFVQLAAMAGARTVEINPEPTGAGFHDIRAGLATQAVPDWVDALLSRPHGAPGPPASLI